MDDAAGPRKRKLKPGCATAPETERASLVHRTPPCCQRAPPRGRYKASARGATLQVGTQASGDQWVSVGFLRTYASKGVARLGCVAPCTCAAANLTAHTDAQTSTTAQSEPHPVTSPHGSPCVLELELMTDKEMFKFIALQVH